MERATQMIPILRDSSQSALPTIPDDIIYQLIDCIGPIRVSSLFFLYPMILYQFSFSILVGTGYHEGSHPFSIED